jgi:hypothetical protein
MPHVLKHYHKSGKDYEQMTFIRKNAGEYKANKYDCKSLLN